MLLMPASVSGWNFKAAILQGVCPPIIAVPPKTPAPHGASSGLQATVAQARRLARRFAGRKARSAVRNSTTCPVPRPPRAPSSLEPTGSPAVKPIVKSSKLANIGYDIRGPVLDKARQMED